MTEAEGTPAAGQGARASDGDGRGRVAPTVSVAPVDASNWRDCAALDVEGSQHEFVAPVTRYLALCAYDDGPWHALGIATEGTVVGFAMEAVDPADDTYWIGGLLIDAAHQHRGLGRATVEALLRRARSGSHAGAALSYEPANTVARTLYASLGFVESGETEGQEVVARRSLTD